MESLTGTSLTSSLLAPSRLIIVFLFLQLLFLQNGKHVHFVMILFLLPPTQKGCAENLQHFC